MLYSTSMLRPTAMTLQFEGQLKIVGNMSFVVVGDFGDLGLELPMIIPGLNFADSRDYRGRVPTGYRAVVTVSCVKEPEPVKPPTPDVAG